MSSCCGWRQTQPQGQAGRQAGNETFVSRQEMEGRGGQNHTAGTRRQPGSQHTNRPRRHTTHLHAAVCCHQLVLQQRVPQAQLRQVGQQVLVHDRELPAQHAAHVDVGRVRLKALIVTQDLARAGGRHGRDQQGVAHAVGRDVGAQLRPVPACAGLLQLRREADAQRKSPVSRVCLVYLQRASREASYLTTDVASD
jgi:hypothetical protein